MLMGSMLSPMTKRGNACFSTTSKRNLSRCRMEAATDPAGPAPIIRTSVSITFIRFIKAKILLDGFRLKQSGHFFNVAGQGAVIFQFGRTAANEIVQFAEISAEGTIRA